ncbi:AraC family transcriptional regulator [uncultured Chryseobacterium sp.]|uniref:helix-turn-helix domain-containing protein n=1 Tax=uncultured Chryseobacterium sp. TaxID=259322 RepID=UPI0025E5A4EC|nr:AraC family transcriptional regulator [uncultured Chryseobacterium sp.]
MTYTMDMTDSPQEILPGVIFYSYRSAVRTEKVFLWNHPTLILQVSGQFTLETSVQTIVIGGGELLLIGKNQVGTMTKVPPPGAPYETIVISLQEDLLRTIALEEGIQPDGTYQGLPNRKIPVDDFLKGYFQSVVPYARRAGPETTDALGLLKVKEAVLLLLQTSPELRDFLFDFSAPHKIDLEKFMLNHFRFNIPLDQFAQLTGRSLSAFKRDFRQVFGSPPRQWLQDKRLDTARYLIGTKKRKASEVYLELGFQSLSHFSYAFKKKFGHPPSGKGSP